MFGPDVPASLTTDELRQLVEGVRFIESMRSNPVDKDAVARDMAPLRQAFFKSVVAAVDIQQGTVLEPQHLAVKKPGTGIPADKMESLIGRRVKRAIARDELLGEEDLV
jgi:N-acetylneuraminate synthase